MEGIKECIVLVLILLTIRLPFVADNIKRLVPRDYVITFIPGFNCLEPGMIRFVAGGGHAEVHK